MSFIRPTWPLTCSFQLPVNTVRCNETFHATSATICCRVSGVARFLIGRFQIYTMFGILVIVVQRYDYRSKDVRRTNCFLGSKVIQRASTSLLAIARCLKRTNNTIRGRNRDSKRVALRRLRNTIIRFNVFTSLTRIMTSSKGVILLKISVFGATSTLSNTLLRSITTSNVRNINEMSGSASIVR